MREDDRCKLQNEQDQQAPLPYVRRKPDFKADAVDFDFERDLGSYDFIFGRKYLTRYGIRLQFDDKRIVWDGISIAMPTETTPVVYYDETYRDESNDERERRQYAQHNEIISKDLLLRTKMQTNMELVRQRRQGSIEQNNKRENRRRIKHTYQAGDKVLILPNMMDPKMPLNQGPYKVLSYDESSGTVRIQRKNCR